MSDTPRFDPLFPQHAIERCSWSVFFSEQVPAKLYASISDIAKQLAPTLSLQEVPFQGIGFDINTARVIQGPPLGAFPIEFTTPDGGVQFSMTPSQLTWTTSRYVRWEPFLGEIEQLPITITNECVRVVSIAALKLEYWDRFIWSGDWTNFEVSKLLRTDTPLAALNADQHGSGWHNHVGWFEPCEGTKRRLVNTNIDVADLVRVNVAVPKPSVGIYTMMQDNFVAHGELPIEIDASATVARTNLLHNDLKHLLSRIISDDMQARIRLRERG